MQVIRTAKQINDALVVRILTKSETHIVQEILGVALVWAMRRGISVVTTKPVGKMVHKISLPDEYKVYQDWTRLTIPDGNVRAMFYANAEMIHDVGWSSGKRFMKPWSNDELVYISNHLPDLSWLTRK